MTAPERHILRQRPLRVTGCRRHVDHEDVECAPHSSEAIWVIADITIGPRRSSRCLPRPENRSMIARPKRCAESSSCRVQCGLSRIRSASAPTVRSVGVEQADAHPRSRRPNARLIAVVDFPTPPLPEATAMTAEDREFPLLRHRRTRRGCVGRAVSRDVRHAWACRCGAAAVRARPCDRRFSATIAGGDDAGMARTAASASGEDPSRRGLPRHRDIDRKNTCRR